jgi:hypothetical protein
MPRVMLDTDTCSYILKRSQPLVLKRLQAVDVADVGMSVITKAELLYGVEVSPRRAHDAAALAAFLPYVQVVDFSDDAALHYAEIAPISRSVVPDRRQRSVDRGACARPRPRTRHEQHSGVTARQRSDAG